MGDRAASSSAGGGEAALEVVLGALDGVNADA